MDSRPGVHGAGPLQTILSSSLRKLLLYRATKKADTLRGFRFSRCRLNARRSNARLPVARRCGEPHTERIYRGSQATFFLAARRDAKHFPMRHWKPVVLLLLLIAASLLVERLVVEAKKHRSPVLLPPRRNHAENRFNVLLIAMETTRRGHLSCYGYDRETTPNLDRLAADGLRFTHAEAVSNWTLPTHASMFSGLYPDSHGARFLSKDELPDPSLEQYEGRMVPACRTMAELLLEAGYRTGAVCGNPGYLDRRFQLDQGFEHYDARPGVPPNWYRPAEQITDEAIRWLKYGMQVEPERPFFLFLNYMDPHHPYNPPPEYVRRFAKHNDDELRPRREKYFRDLFVRVNQDGETLTEKQSALLVDRYDGEIAYTDHEIGRLIDWLRGWNLYQDTIIILTGDHGEALGEHGVRGHCFRLYEGELAVPMIVKLPHSEARGVRDEGVQHVDVLPTVLDRLGLPCPGEVQGQSMLDLKPRDLLAAKHLDYRMLGFPPPLGQNQWALYRGRMKYVQYADYPPELFDLENDPGEMVNLARKRPDEVRTLHHALDQLRQNIRPLGPFTPAVMPQNKKTAEKLRELGYAE